MRFLAKLKEKRFIIFLNNKLNKYLLLKLYLTAETTSRIIDLKRIISGFYIASTSLKCMMSVNK